MSGFQVREYRPGDEQAILDLFNRVFTEDDPAFPQRSLASWRHRYVDNPHGLQVLVAEDEQGRLIANYSAIALDCSVRGERRSCSQPVDSVVERAWRASLRRDSVFVTIGKAFQERYCTPGAAFCNEYMYGLPNDKAFRVGTRILGYVPVHCPMPVLVKEFDAAWVEGLEREAGATTARLEDWGILPEVEALFLRHLEAVPLGTWRDARYLAWRYRDWPDTRYHLLAARRGGELVGASVYSLGWMGHPILPLLDWIGPGEDREALAALLAAAGRTTLEHGGRRMETWATPPMAHHRTLASLGLQVQASPFNLCIMVFSRDFDLPWAVDHWVLTMGDSDIY